MSDRKTAEERAKEVVARGFETRAIADWGIDDPDHLERLVAAAIREAEDEALERAAQFIVDSSPTHQRQSIWGDPAYDGFRIGIDHALGAIRRLKSKETGR